MSFASKISMLTRAEPVLRLWHSRPGGGDIRPRLTRLLSVGYKQKAAFERSLKNSKKVLQPFFRSGQNCGLQGTKTAKNRTAAIVFVSSRRIESYTYTLTTKSQLQNLISSQGHERPLGDLSSPCCKAFDASRWEKHFGDYPMSLAQLKQKL